ncbi:MAG TPA: hypothetical protein DEP35_09045, partial [Deltaproteobacteria bacterium]|nr:hypothetical protein [Deltaproteobacteria bacterium]
LERDPRVREAYLGEAAGAEA